MLATPEELQRKARRGDDAVILVTPHPRAAEWDVSYRYGGADEWQPATLLLPGTFFNPYHSVPGGTVAWAVADSLLLPADAEVRVIDRELGTLVFPHPR